MNVVLACPPTQSQPSASVGPLNPPSLSHSVGTINNSGYYSEGPRPPRDISFRSDATASSSMGGPRTSTDTRKQIDIESLLRKLSSKVKPTQDMSAAPLPEPKQLALDDEEQGASPVPRRDRLRSPQLISTTDLHFATGPPSEYSSAYEDDPSDTNYVNELDVGAQRDKGQKRAKMKYTSDEVRAVVKRPARYHGEGGCVDCYSIARSRLFATTIKCSSPTTTATAEVPFGASSLRR